VFVFQNAIILMSPQRYFFWEKVAWGNFFPVLIQTQNGRYLFQSQSPLGKIKKIVINK